MDVTLDCARNLTNQNFTNQALLCISGYKNDACNGTGIAGWLITLNNSSYNISILTGSDGKYEFCDLVPGDYTLTEETKDGYISSGTVSLDVTLDCARNLTNQNFTNQALLCISGYKLDDCTKAGIAGWLITLNNSSYNTSILTGSDGKYEFCDLVPGDYTITEETKDGYISSGTVSLDVTLPCTGNLTDQNFTNTKLLCISGKKINACTGNGISNWDIIVKNSSTGIEAGRNRTISGGGWIVCGLVPGEYQVSEILKTGWKNITNLTQNVTLNCENKTDINFRNIQLRWAQKDRRLHRTGSERLDHHSVQRHHQYNLSHDDQHRRRQRRHLESRKFTAWQLPGQGGPAIRLDECNADYLECSSAVH